MLSKHGTEYAGEACTLDGKPAMVCNALGKFGVIQTFGPNHQRVEFSWDAITRVMERNENNGEFKS